MISSALAPIAIRHYRFIPGIGVPLIVTVIGIFSKKLARGKRWERSHFYSGTELTLAAMAAALLNLGDLIKPDATPPANLMTLVGLNVGAALITLISLLFVVSLHQDWESKTKERPKLSFFWLILVSNVIGFGLLAAVVILIPVS